MQARRDSLKSVKVSEHTHAGLWLDKFLTDKTEKKRSAQTEKRSKDEPSAKAEALLIKELGTIKVPDGYKRACERREEIFSKLQKSHSVACAKATVEGRMIIGLGQKGPVEAGLALEHTWGVPMIPGSALKGLTMAAAHLLLEDEAWRKGVGHSLKILGGTTERIGSVIFHDAWWIPEQDKLPIHPDVMTVHHPDYYNKDGNKAPSDMDSPIPIPFASVTGKYLVVVERTFPLKAEEQEDVLEAALYILKLGLAHLGIGAKTNAGYGRMTLDFECEAERQYKREEEAAADAERQQREQQAAQRKAEQQKQLARSEARTQVEKVKINNAADMVPKVLSVDWEESERKDIAQQLVSVLTRKAVVSKAQDSKRWAIDLLKAAAMEA